MEKKWVSKETESIPRTGGGDPELLIGKYPQLAYSPHRRG